MEETLSRTNLGLLNEGSNVNLESSLKLGGKIGGHMVQGHVDCVSKIKSIAKKSSSWEVKFEKPKGWFSKKFSSSVNQVDQLATILEERSIWQRYGF